MVNSKSVMELLADIGVYPIPAELSVTNVLKGWFLLIGFVIYICIEIQVALWISISSLFVPDSTTVAVSQAVHRFFWTTLIYLVNKRKIRVIISGVDLHDPIHQELLKNSIILSNHKSLFDFLLIYYLKTLTEKATSDGIMLSFFNWNNFWQTPGLAVLWNFMHNDENWEMNIVELEQSLNDLIKQSSNNWIVHFPEVNICTEKNRLVQGQELDKYFLPRFKDLLYPRFANFNNLIKVAHNSTVSNIRNIVGLTILYYNPLRNDFFNPTLFEILTLKQPEFIINVDFKLKPLSKLPTKHRKLEKWLEAEWSEKDKILELMRSQLKLTIE